MNRSIISAPTKPMTLRKLHALLRKLSGAGFTGVEDRNRAIDELREANPEQLFPLLTHLLNHRGLDVRCHTAEAILRLDRDRAVQHVLPLLNDRSRTLRWHICGLFSSLGDTRTIPALIERLQKDTDPQIRNTAAYALGGIGSFQALRALITAEQNDHEFDIHGHSASSVATNALSDILMKEAIQIVETYPELTVTQDHELNTFIRASIIPQSRGEEYHHLSWEA
jgi:HEAT repeat protein